MIQTVCTAQELYARAALVGHARLPKLQEQCALGDAEGTLRGAFWQDVRPAIEEWRKSRRLPAAPRQAFRTSGYLERITRERREKNRDATASYALGSDETALQGRQVISSACHLSELFRRGQRYIRGSTSV